MTCALLSAGAAHAGDAAPAAVPAAAQDRNTIQADPAVLQGVLPNGLRYLIMRNATPAGAVSLRLGIDVGSFEETPAESGAAHFNEHLAFSGGDNGHEAGPEAAFAQAGVAFGHDINAETGLFHTVYRLDMPKADAGALDLAFSWLRTVADGTRFTQTAVDHERGIILSEWEADLSPMASAEQTEQDFQAPGLRTSRDVLGSPQSLAGLDAPKLEAFYKRWYRPDNAVLVVVGDLPTDVLRQRIVQSFASWTVLGPAPVKPAFGALDPHRGEASLDLPGPNLSTLIKVCRLQPEPPQGADDVTRYRARLATALADQLLNDALDDATRTAHAPYIDARIDTDTDRRETRTTCLRVAPLDGAWRPALAAAQTELRRFLANGPSDDDLDQAIEMLRAQRRGEADQAATRSSISLASDMVEITLDHDVVDTPREEFWAFDAAVETLTAKDVQAALQHDWSGAGPLFSMYGPAPEAQAARAAWDAAEATPPPGPRPAAQTLRWAYADHGRPGKVKSRLALTHPDFVRIIYDNGVVLNFKQTDFAQHAVAVSVRFGHGRRDIPDDQYIAAMFGSGLFSGGGLRRQNADEVRKLFADIAWSAKLNMGNDGFVLDGDTNASSLRSQLQILAAYLSEPGFSAELDPRIPTAINELYQQARSNPSSALDAALQAVIAPGGPDSLPPQAKLSSLRMSDIKRLYQPIITQSPLEVTLVGDVDEAKATELVGETFGALPPRSEGPRPQAHIGFVRYPDTAPPPIIAHFEGPTDKALVRMIWPLYVATPERRREEVSLLLLAQVFDDALRHRVRQELGKTYSPEVATEMPDHADQGVLGAAVETAPADVDLVRQETLKLAQQLAQGQISAEALETARKPIIAQMTADQRDNWWWVGSLSGSSQTDDGLEQLRVYQTLAETVTLAEVKAVAATWLSRPPIIGVALPQTPAAGPPAP